MWCSRRFLIPASSYPHLAKWIFAFWYKQSYQSVSIHITDKYMCLLYFQDICLLFIWCKYIFVTMGFKTVMIKALILTHIYKTVIRCLLQDWLTCWHQSVKKHKSERCRSQVGPAKNVIRQSGVFLFRVPASPFQGCSVHLVLKHALKIAEHLGEPLNGFSPCSSNCNMLC